ncbi:hypothetical protein S83_006542 [Arachis hypogaea]
MATSKSSAGTAAIVVTARVRKRAVFGCVYKGWRDSYVLLLSAHGTAKDPNRGLAMAASESGAGTATTRVRTRAAFGCVCKGWSDSGILLRLNVVKGMAAFCCGGGPDIKDVW